MENLPAGLYQLFGWHFTIRHRHAYFHDGNGEDGLEKATDIGSFLILISIVSTIVLPGFGFLMASRVVLGVGAGIYTISAYSIVAKLAPPGRKASALANLSMGSSAALVLGVPIGRIVAASYDWKIIFWVIGFFSLLSIFAVSQMIPEAEGEAPIPLASNWFF